MKQLILSLSLGLLSYAHADIDWMPYSAAEVSKAVKENKKVVLGFHKRGCGTCKPQDMKLEKTGITKNKNIAFFKVERKDKDLTSVYEMYGFSQRQWAALILINEKGELARVEPGNTNGDDIAKFASIASNEK